MSNFLVLPSDNIIDLDSIAFVDGTTVYLKHVHISGASGSYDHQRMPYIGISVDDKEFLLETLQKKKTEAL